MAAAVPNISRLVTLLNGSIIDKETAAKALADLDTENAQAVQNAGAIPPLVALLGSTTQSAASEAAKALAILAPAGDELRLAIHDAGALPALVRLLEGGSSAAQGHAALALAGLLAFDNEENKQAPLNATLNAGALPHLVTLLTRGSSEIQANAAWVFINLSTGNDELRSAIIDAGAVPPLVTLLTSGSGEAQENALWALANLALTGDERRRAILNAGALPPLLSLLTSGSTEEHAAWALANLADGNDEMRHALINGKALPPLVTVLTNSSTTAQDHVARALANLALGSDKMKRSIISAGALPPLVTLLANRRSEEPGWAALALAHLARGSDDMKLAIITGGALPPLVTLLSTESSEAQVNAARAFANLADGDDEMKRSILSAGALPPLVALSRSGTEEAKAAASRAICALEEITAQEDLQAENQRLKAALAHLQASIFPQISRIEFGFHDVPLASPIGMYVSHLLESTVVQHRVQLGQPDFAPAPRLRAVKIEKLVSERLYETYMTGIHSLGGRYREPGCALFDAFPHLRVHPASLCTGRVDLNEHFVFHGATADVVSQICTAGFDPQRGGEGAGKLFGVASYFAPNSSKSDIYTEDFARRLPRGAERKMIVARVILGQSFRVADQCPQRTRPPDGYDSVWADSRANGGCVDHPEIMIYKEQQALPQYVVTYVHNCPADGLCAECLKRPPN